MLAIEEVLLAFRSRACVDVPKVRVCRINTTLSVPKMLLGVLLRLVLLGLTAEAIGPVVSNNEWTPVVNSQRVYLSEETLAKYRQQESAQQR